MEIVESWQERYDRHLGYLNPELAALWIEKKLSMKDLPEFVYGLDQLDDIINTQHFKNNRILETPDTHKLGGIVDKTFNACRLYDKDFSWKIKSVGPGTWDAMNEFFINHDYVNVFFRVMRAMANNKVNVTLSGRPLYFRLEVTSPHPLFAVFEYVDVNEGKVLKMPFLLNRLGKSVTGNNYYPKPIMKKVVS